MGYLLQIVLALGALALAESSILPAAELTWLLFPLCAAPHALGHLAKSSFLRGRFRLAELFHALLQASPLVLYAASLWIAGWLRLCEEWTGVRPGILTWPNPALFLALAPFLIFTLIAIDARARCGAAERKEIGALRRFQTRMFLSGLAPLAIFVGVASLIDVFPPARIHIEEVSLWGGCFALLLLGFMVLAMPVLLANTWETTRLGAGLERAALEAVAARAGFRYRDLMVWNTGNLFANAAIVGVAPRLRYVLFSDALLAQLALPELVAVFGHEIGHARRAHVAIFGVWTAAFFLFADLCSSWIEPLGRGLSSAAILLVLGLWYLSFGYISRRFELEADLESCDLIGGREALVGALRQVGGVHLAQRSSWRHFPTSKRIEFLEQVEIDPRAATRLRTQLRVLAWLGVSLFCVALVLEIRNLAGSYERDRVVVDLRLGRYELAARRAVQTELDPELLELVDLAAGLATTGEDPGLEAVEAAARTALAQGDLRRAAGYLELGAMRGRVDLEDVREALVLISEGRRDKASELVERCSEEWRELLGLSNL